jgi:LDH2 family malate/lactate/ureidoglycolate dehydrogenase
MAQVAQDVVRVEPGRLKAFSADVGRRSGFSADDAELFAHALVAADLRGIPTHGTFRLPAYARALALGEVNHSPVVREVAGRGACRVWDADNGSGLIVGQRAMDEAIKLAAEHGMGAVAIRRSNHAGMLAVHVERATAAGMIGMFVSNCPPMMAPFGGREPLLSNAPMAWGLPTQGEPLIADMACSFVARGTIRIRAQQGEAIPEGWALDEHGAPTTDAQAAMAGVLLPMAGHKGYALAVVNELLAAALAGATLSLDISTAFLSPGARHYDSWGAGQFALAIDPAAFGGRERFQAIATQLSDALVASEPSIGSDGVLLPGQPEAGRTASALEDGIPLGPATVAALREYCDEAGLSWSDLTGEGS